MLEAPVCTECRTVRRRQLHPDKRPSHRCPQRKDFHSCRLRERRTRLRGWLRFAVNKSLSDAHLCALLGTRRTSLREPSCCWRYVGRSCVLLLLDEIDGINGAEARARGEREEIYHRKIAGG